MTNDARMSSLLFVAGLLIVGCAGAGKVSTTQGPMEVCGDGVDNDADGKADCQDADCAANPSCTGANPVSTGQLEPSWETCAVSEGDRSHTPVDIIWTVDSSFSMKEEMGWIQQNLNDFVEFMRGVTLDVRVVLLGGQDVCVPEPLAGPNCSDGERYRHIADYVGSHDSLEKLISLYPKYKDFVRPRGRKVMIVATDDDSDVSAEWFDEQVKQLPQPGFPDGFVFHSIVSYGTHPRGCLTGAASGDVYLDLSERTQGSKFPICETDWTKIFNELGTSVIDMIDLQCTYPVAQLPAGKKVNPDQLQVNFLTNGQWKVMPRVSGQASCGQTEGWYFDNASATITLCQQTCGSKHILQVKAMYGCLDSGGLG